MSVINKALNRLTSTAGAYDTVHLETGWGQISDKNIYANVGGGWLKLDTGGKIPTSLFPSAVLNSQEPAGTLSANTTTAAIHDTLEAYATSNSRSVKGLYLIATTTIVITASTGDTVNDEENGGTITGDGSTTFTIESGDWLICVNYTNTSTAEFAVLNNTYKDATTSAPGIVQLSNLASLADYSANGSGKVLTALNLYNLIYGMGGTDRDNSLLKASGNAGSADKLYTARTISLSGDVTGSNTFDGSANMSITATVVDDSHNHHGDTVSYNGTSISNIYDKTGVLFTTGFTLTDFVQGLDYTINLDRTNIDAVITRAFNDFPGIHWGDPGAGNYRVGDYYLA